MISATALALLLTCVGADPCNATADEQFTVSMTYNDLGQIGDSVYPDCTAPANCAGSDTTYARTVQNVYDGATGHLTGVRKSTDAAGANSYAKAISYHPNGTLNMVTHGNSMDSIYGLDPQSMQRLASFKVQYLTNPATFDSGTYLYDGSGNIKKIGANWYIYDKVQRITEGMVDYVSATNNRKHRFAYDVYGNLTNIYESTNGGAEFDRNNSINSALNRHATTVAGYDAQGNVTSLTSNSNSYVWDALGMMRSLTASGGTWVYFYTADDERIWSQKTTTNSGSWTIRDLANRPLRQYNTTGAVGSETWSFANDAVYRGDKLLSKVTPTGTFQYHLDHLGSPRLITDAARTVIARYSYYPFGREASSIIATTPEARKFTGHERDYNGGTGSDNVDYTDYMHARYYTPIQGRFLSTDPAFDWSTNAPQSWNLYTYVRNTPVTTLDPTGKWIESAWDAANLIAGAASLVGNVRGGNYGAATIDAVGVALDGLALAAPVVPGGASAAIKAIRAADRVDDATDAAKSGNRSTDFVVTPKGEAIAVPNGAQGPKPPNRGSGIVYDGGSGGKGMDKRVTGVRLMDANKHQSQRVNYMNKQGQTVDPTTGHTISKSDTRGHKPVKPFKPGKSNTKIEE